MPKDEIIEIEHEIPETWSTHIGEVKGQLCAAEGRITQAKAAILDAMQDREWMRKHLGVLVAQIEKAEHLPPDPLEPYRLSEDGKKIIGRVKSPARKEQ